ncbi:MAG: tRNA threonylcarbamoyladenosine dehydratase [Clostridia bacterium]|nr:tRNA threonylcarbamoyladenosine dehydratase [Clostridia bacterium]
MSDMFLRTKSLIGEDNLAKLKGSSVAVFGLGGVGSYAAEALTRSGIGTLYIYDNDTVSQSNINRQLIALPSTVGEKKTDLVKSRCLSVNPEIRIHDFCEFITPESKIPFEKFDFIIDAVDNVTAKIFLAKNAQNKNIPIISVMGTGNKLHPEKLTISDIYKTYECPLCKVMRYELKKRGIKKLPVVWSDETPKKPENLGETKGSHPAPASMVFVPATAGITAASYAIRKLMEK